MKTNPLSIKNIEKIATNIRNQFNISEDDAFPILEVLDQLFVDGSLSIQYLDDDNQMFELDTPAKYNANENFIYIKNSVLDEYENANYRAAFTLAHELFHYLQVQVLGFEFIDEEANASYEDPEWQANEFAGQLLIPTKYIDLSDEELINRFHVSYECVAVRKLYNKRRNKK